jgi:hypothetical protein
MREMLELAARQHGVVTGAQLVALGLSRAGSNIARGAAGCFESGGGA